jgi:hypothetical protein
VKRSFSLISKNMDEHEDNPFYELFSAQERDLDFEEFWEPINEIIENQVDFFMRFRDPSNTDFDDIPAEVRRDPVNVIMQITEKMEDEICINFITSGFDDEEISKAWKIFRSVVKNRCKELL